MVRLIAILLASAALAGSAGSSPAAGPAPGGPKAAYEWPVAEVRVVRRFDPPPEPWLPGHRGVDLAGSSGTPVMAAGAGTVSFAGKVAGRGVVSIVHPDGLKTTYEPLTLAIIAGQHVTRGYAIGTLEYGHCETEACLHWGAKRGDTYLDPLSLLGLGPIRLKPLNGEPLKPLNGEPASGIRNEPAATVTRQRGAARRRRTRRPGRRSAAAHRSR